MLDRFIILAVLAIAALALPAQAAMDLIEDFDDVSDWSANGNDTDNTLTAVSGMGEVVMTSNTSVSHYIGLGGNAIADGASGTIFFQVENPSTNTGIDHFAGFTVADSPGAYSGYNGYIFSQDSPPSYDYFARDGGGGTATSTALADDTLYNVWLVIDNSAKTYDVYINTGLGPATAGDQVWNDLAFRTNTDPSGLAVDTFGIFGQDSMDTDGTVLYDNVYVLTGADVLNNPVIPEPTTAALLGLAGLALIRVRGRRRAV